MAALSSDPGSITASQRRAFFAAGKRLGLSRDDLRAAAGGSLAKLSRRQASELILRVGGGPARLVRSDLGADSAVRCTASVGAA